MDDAVTDQHYGKIDMDCPVCHTGVVCDDGICSYCGYDFLAHRSRPPVIGVVLIIQGVLCVISILTIRFFL